MADAPVTPSAGQTAAAKVVEAVKQKGQGAFMEWVFPVLADIGIGSAFHYFGQRHIDGKLSELDKRKLEEARDLHAAGKTEEARQIIQAHIGGMGFNDEYIVWSTSLRILFAGALSEEQKVNFCNFLEGMTKRENEKFREMFSVEINEDLRDVNMLRFAQLPPQRMLSVIRGSGTFHMTTWDNIDDGAKELADHLEPHYEQLRQEFLGRLSGTYENNQPKTTTTRRHLSVRMGSWFRLHW